MSIAGAAIRHRLTCPICPPTCRRTFGLSCGAQSVAVSQPKPGPTGQITGSGADLDAPIRRELFLDHGRVFIKTPRLMTDDELADVLAAFVAEVRGRAPIAPTQAPKERQRGLVVGKVRDEAGLT
jgi:hypothetical protein